MRDMSSSPQPPLVEEETRFNGSPELAEGGEEGEGESKPLIVGAQSPTEEEGDAIATVVGYCHIDRCI